MAYSLRERWCLAVGAPEIIRLGRDPEEIGGWSGIARSRGEYEVYMQTAQELKAAYGITTRAELIAWTRGLLHGSGERAWDMARVIAVVGSAVGAQIMSHEDAWQVILLAGKLAQQAYRSWEDFAAAYTRASELSILEQPTMWRELPWDTELDVTIIDPKAGAGQRVLRTSCPTCSAPRVRGSPTAYVYCDYCGQLMDYDFMVALEHPAQRPGPVYEALAAHLAPELAAARDRDDRDAYRATQRQLFEAWVDACPSAVPVRVKQPAYRAGFVAWLAEAQTVAAFDELARTTEAAMNATIARLVFMDIEGKPRVSSERFHALADAMFAYEARRDELCTSHGVYDLHPDRASRELQRRVGFSAFVQGWLPLLDESEARWIVERTALAREYAVVAEPATHAASCTHCNAPLSLVTGARRVVCDHCGQFVDVVGHAAST